MGPGPMMGPRNNDDLREPKPQKLSQVPGYIFRTVKKFFSRLIYIFRLVWETRPWILFALMFFSVLTGVIPLLSALVAKDIINGIADAYISSVNGGEFKFDGILKSLIISFIIVFSHSIINTLKNMVTRISGELVVNHVNVKIMRKAREIDLASYDDPQYYSKLENASREAGMRPIQILQSTFSLISTAISMVSFVIVLSGISTTAPLIIVALATPSAIISFVYRKKNFNYIRMRSKDRRQLSYYSGLVIDKDKVKEVRMYGLSDVFVDRYKGVFKKYFGGLRRLYVNEGTWNMTIAIVSATVNCLLFLFVAYKAAGGEIQIGDYSLYTGALSSISSSVNSLISTVATVFEGTLFIDNLIMFMNEKPRIVPQIPTPVSPQRHIAHEIELKNVSFKYPGSEKFVIQNVSLKIKAGSTVALVGLNGAGKTTLIKLITRLYDPTEGEIFLDGRNIKDYNVTELYSVFGIIFQDFGKYAVSVKENIAFSTGTRADDIDTEKMYRSAEESAASDFIDALPKKYDTQLMKYFDENGVELSIGQWQKLSVARAFYADSDILVLDEPTAALDAIAEQEIYNQFDELRMGKTTVFVSHRLSSVTTADMIIVLEDGKLEELGTHHELLEKRGKYYTLFSTQAKRYIESSEEEAKRDVQKTQRKHLPPISD